MSLNSEPVGFIVANDLLNAWEAQDRFLKADPLVYIDTVINVVSAKGSISQWQLIDMMAKMMPSISRATLRRMIELKFAILNGEVTNTSIN